MTNKNKNWHKAWERLPSGGLRHTSGAEFILLRSDGYTDIKVSPETLGEYQAHELMRGVALHDLKDRLIRLAKEASKWHSKNPVKN
jgi:hypothetical protein